MMISTASISGRCELPNQMCNVDCVMCHGNAEGRHFAFSLHNRRQSRRGVTLIEVLIAVVISAIAMFALVPPFLAEGNLFRKGKRQTEAQRDAQMALRAMARVGRSGLEAPVIGSNRVGFTVPCTLFGVGAPLTARVVFLSSNGQLQMTNFCLGSGVTSTLIDGTRSRVTSFTSTAIIPNKLVHVQLQVTHSLTATDPQSELETLDTELFLRNAT